MIRIELNQVSKHTITRHATAVCLELFELTNTTLLSKNRMFVIGMNMHGNPKKITRICGKQNILFWVTALLSILIVCVPNLVIHWSSGSSLSEFESKCGLKMLKLKLSRIL